MGMSGGGIEAGRAFVKFLLDDKEFTGKLKTIGKQLTKFGAIGSAITAPLVAAMAVSVNAFANTGSALADMAGRTNVSVELLQVLGYAAKQTGTDLDTVEKAILFMRKE